MSQVTRMTRTGSMPGARKTTRPGGQHAGGATMAADARSNDAAAIMLRAIMSADGRQVGQQKGLGL